MEERPPRNINLLEAIWALIPQTDSRPKGVFTTSGE